MAPAYKLTYFNLYGIIEGARFLLHYGNIDFEDSRVELDQWAVVKPTTPYGTLPLFEYNGKVINQSMAIHRFIGKLVKLIGSNDWEAAEIDNAAETVLDFVLKIRNWFYESDPAIKEKRHGPLFNEIMPYYLERLDKQVQNNNGYLAIGKLSWVDFYFIGLLDYLKFMLGEDLTEKAPNLKKLKEKVYGIPQVKDWLSKRPKTSF